MAETKWTDAQLRAIENEPNILVNAAAGSGKTAVLVERIIRKLLPDKNGEYIDADKLLVVTFARDAAAEMSQRIKDRLIKILRESRDTALRSVCRKQIRLLPIADITTIDAFCIKTVRNNFHLLGIDPRFTVMDNIEAVMLKGDVISKLFDSLYEAEDAGFLRLSGIFGGAGDDSALEKIILELYGFTRSLPDPEDWLDECAARYITPELTEEWKRYSLEKAAKGIRQITALLAGAIDIGRGYAAEQGGSAEDIIPPLCRDNYWQELVSEYELFAHTDITSYDNIAETLGKGITKYRKGMGSGEFKAVRNAMTDCKNKAIETADKLRGFFPYKSEELCAELSEVYETVHDVCGLCAEFAAALAEEKESRCSYEFNDLEHLCLKLLRDYPEVRQEYSCTYAEGLMDEYQDTNGLQEAIFSLLSNGTNRFMVGDMKQSIYRFRMSDPFIFREKDILYRSGKGGTVIDLNANFRSRPQVLDSVNAVFERIMRSDTAEIEYNDAQRLKLGNTEYLKTDLPCYKSELCVIEETGELSEEDIDRVRLEAGYIAGRIRKMLDEGFPVTDKETGRLRPCRKSDFAILAGSVKTVSNEYLDELARAGIDAAAEGTGFFDCSEVILALDFIRIINNPQQDIPLVCVLRSPVYRFSEEELAAVRSASRGSFYNALCAYAEKTGNEKCRRFLEMLDHWRSESEYLGASALLWRVYTDTSLIDIVGAMDGGGEAQANLRLLFERARGFEQSGYKGIFNFCTYIEKLREEGTTAAPAPVPAADTVRIMTIHKSKGLEFPIVFVCSAGKKFNYDKTAGFGMRMHRQYGLGMSRMQPEKRVYSQTLPQTIIEDVQRNEAAAENIRKLYVALTRPREKLIVVGTVTAAKTDSRSGEATGGVRAAYERWSSGEWNSSEKIVCARSYLDLIAPAVIADTKKENPVWEYHEIMPDGAAEEAAQGDEDLVQDIGEEEYDEALYKAVSDILSREYPYKEQTLIPSRMYVTEVQQLADGGTAAADEELKRRPSFGTLSGITGADVGTAYHTLLSEMDIKKDMDAEYIRSEIHRLAEDGKIDPALEKSVKADSIMRFFDSDIGRELCSAEPMRETPFEILADADEIYTDGSGGGGQLLLQGIIDCWFIRDDGTVCLADYKTDRVNEASELVKRYSVQLGWYKKALERLTGRRVSGVYIYSLYLSEAVELFGEN